MKRSQIRLTRFLVFLAITAVLTGFLLLVVYFPYSRPIKAVVAAVVLSGLLCISMFGDIPKDIK